MMAKVSYLLFSSMITVFLATTVHSFAYAQATMPDDLINKPAITKSKPSPPKPTQSSPQEKREPTKPAPPTPQEEPSTRFLGTYLADFQLENANGKKYTHRSLIQIYKNDSTGGAIHFREHTTNTFIDTLTYFSCSKTRSYTNTAEGVCQISGDIVTLKQLTVSDTNCGTPDSSSFRLKDGNLEIIHYNGGKLISGVFVRQ